MPVDTCKCVTADFLFLQNQAAFLLRFAVSTQYPTLESVINMIYYRQQSSTPHPIYWKLYLLDTQVRKYLLHPTRRKSLSKNIDISKKDLLLIWNQIRSLPGSSFFFRSILNLYASHYARYNFFLCRDKLIIYQILVIMLEKLNKNRLTAIERAISIVEHMLNIKNCGSIVYYI